MKQDKYPFPIEIVRKAVKRLTIKVTREGTVRITMPPKMAEQYAWDFLDTKLAWVEKSLATIRDKKNATTRSYGEGQRLMLLNTEFLLHIRPGQDGLVADKEEITISAPDMHSVNYLLDKYLAKVAKANFQRIFDHIWSELAATFAVPKPQLIVKHALSQWGSYSAHTNTVRLNDKLILYPRAALELIIVHELCHIKVCNHGVQFYKWLEHILPDWRERKRLLRGG